MTIRQPVFETGPLQGVSFFKLTDHPRGRLYITDDAADVLRAADLSGLQLVEV